MAQLKDLLVTGDSRFVGNVYNNSPKIAYGTCSTAAATAAKVVTISDPTWNLQVGDIIGVKFTNTNSASSCTLNVNSTGAKSLWYNNAAYTGNSNMICGYANRYTFYMYDGTYWVWLSYGNENSGSDTYPSAYCSTGAGTAAKAATCTNYQLLANSFLHIVITNANTSAGALTLNVNGKGAKPIYINGAASSASNYTLPAGSYIIFYNGTNYYFRTDGKLTASITGDAATVNGKTVAVNVPSDAKFTDTTYSDATTSAHGLMSTTDKTKLNNTNIAYGTCSTAAGTAQKDVTLSGNTNWTLAAGSLICIKFSNTNTASNPKIKVGNTDAKSVWYNTGVITTGSLGYAGTANRPSIYMYDGTQYVWVGWALDANDNTYTSAYCSTGAGTAAKTATCTNYALLNNSYTQVLITTSNTAQSALTMNINGKGAKPIYINGLPSSATNYALPAGSYLTYYDGTAYHFRTDGRITNISTNVYVGTTAPTDPAIEVWVDPSGTIDNSSFINLIYPVGSIYMTTDATIDPNVTFGVGTWVKIKDRFLLGSGDTYTSGNTGGAATVALQTKHMPPHTHSQASCTNPGNHAHNTWNIFSFKHSSGGVTTTCTGEPGDGRGNATDGNGGHTHTITLNSTGGENGSVVAHENMPPYKVVNMWERTA